MITRNDAQGFGVPQGSNTGVKKPNPLECGIDWIAGTVEQIQLTGVMAFLCQTFSDEFVEQRNGIHFYTRSYRSALGILVASEPPGGTRTDCYISIPAGVLGSLSPRKVQILMKQLYEVYGFRCSRLDLKIDDYTKTVTPSKAWEAFNNDGISGFKSGHFHSSGKSRKALGETVELGRRGSKGSGKFLRIYDKFAESKGAMDCMRIELELSGDYSRNILPYLATIPFEEFGHWIVNIICSSVTFVKRSENGRLRDSQMLDWWAFIAEGREKITLCRERIMSSIQASERWIHNQVAPTIATLMNACATEEAFWKMFWDAILDGERRMQPRHHAMVNAEKTRRKMKVTLKNEREDER